MYRDVVRSFSFLLPKQAQPGLACREAFVRALNPSAAPTFGDTHKRSEGEVPSINKAGNNKRQRSRMDRERLFKSVLHESAIASLKFRSLGNLTDAARKS